MLLKKMLQCISLKEKHPKALLLFRDDCYYKAFGDDAIRLSKIFGVSIITYKGNDIKEAGFPIEHIAGYIDMMMDAGMCVMLQDSKYIK